MLKNQVCVITGASKSLGKSVAHLFSRNQACLILAVSTANDLGTLAQSIRAAGGKATTVAADASDYLQIHRLFQKVDELYGQVDGLLNGAGIGLFRPLQNFKEDEIVRTVNVNLVGTILTVERILPGCSGLVMVT